MNSDLELIEALGPRSRDIGFFAESVLGVRLNWAQRRWFKLVAALRGHDWVFRRVVHVAANRVGKTLGLAIMLLWACHGKIGLPNADWDAWFTTAYRAYHLAPQYPQALLVYKEMVELMRGSHPAQYDKQTGVKRQMFWSPEMFEEVRFDQQHPGIRLWNGAEIHFSSTDDKAKAIQGVTANIVSIDEAALEDHLLDVVDQVAKLRLASTGGPLWIASTPDGINDFFEVVNTIMLEGQTTFHKRVWEAAKKRSALVWSWMEDNVGFGLTQEEFEFIESDLDPSTKEQAMRGAFISASDAFFTPQDSIKMAWSNRLPNETPAHDGHRYVIFWDPSVASDPTVVIVLDITSKPWRGVYFRRWEKPMPFDTLIQEMYSLHRTYTTASSDAEGIIAPRAVTGFDATSMGGAIIRQQLTTLHPKRGLNFAGATFKTKALTNCRAALSRQDVLIPPSWIRLQREVFGYRREDKKIVQDAVMALTGAIYLASQGSMGATRRPFVYAYEVYGRE